MKWAMSFTGILLAGCGGASSTEKPTTGPTPEQEARRAVDYHFSTLISGDRDAWARTLVSDMEANAFVPDSPPDEWWFVGQRSVTTKKVRYKFDHVVESKPDKVVLMYARMDFSGGAQKGTVPIVVKKEGNAWKIAKVAY